MPPRARPRAATYGRASDLDGLEWLRAHDLGSFARHVHETFSIGLVDRGANVYRYGVARLVAPVGAVCIVAPGDVHTGGEGGAGWSYWNVYPTAEQVRRAAEEASGRACDVPLFRPRVVDDALVARKLAALFGALADRASLLERETRLLDALATLVARHAERARPSPPIGAEPAAVRRAREHLHAHVEANVSLAELACVAHVSEFHLVRVFRAAMGMPPHAYQLSLRVRRAKELLTRGTPIATAAAACGFADQAHLTRHFRAAFGATPGQVLAASKIVQDPTPRGT